MPESALRLGLNGYILLGNDAPANLIHKDYADGLNYQLSLHQDETTPYCKLQLGEEQLTVNIANLYANRD